MNQKSRAAALTNLLGTLFAVGGHFSLPTYRSYRRTHTATPEQIAQRNEIAKHNRAVDEAKLAKLQAKRVAMYDIYEHGAPSAASVEAVRIARLSKKIARHNRRMARV